MNGPRRKPRPWPSIPQEEKDRIIADVKDRAKSDWTGKDWGKVAKEYNVSLEALRCQCDDAHRLRRLEMNKRSRVIGARVIQIVAEHEETRRDAMARLREIPPDTRSLTAWFFGDPIPRSANKPAKSSQPTDGDSVIKIMPNRSYVGSVTPEGRTSSFLYMSVSLPRVRFAEG